MDRNDFDTAMQQIAIVRRAFLAHPNNHEWTLQQLGRATDMLHQCRPYIPLPTAPYAQAHHNPTHRHPPSPQVPTEISAEGPDGTAQAIRELTYRITGLAQRIDELQEAVNRPGPPSAPQTRDSS